MKKLVSTLLLLTVIVAISFGQAAKPITENSLLWEISGKDLKSPSYLFGTIHMINKKDFEITPATKKALAKASKVTFEINMDDMADISKMLPVLMKAFMEGGTTLADLLTEEEYGLVKDHFVDMGLPMMMLDRIKPMFLSALSGEDMLTMNTDSSQVVSYEMELMKLAQEQEMTVAGLETAEFQMSMFDSIPYKAQAKMLLESIKSEDTGDEEFQKMVEMYKSQDINGMQDLIKGDEEGVGKYTELLLVNRNKNWIPIMETMMKEEVVFFAVGAGHLGGEMGVINLLKEEGYKLKAIK